MCGLSGRLALVVLGDDAIAAVEADVGGDQISATEVIDLHAIEGIGDLELISAGLGLLGCGVSRRARRPTPIEITRGIMANIS